MLLSVRANTCIRSVAAGLVCPVHLDLRLCDLPRLRSRHRPRLAPLDAQIPDQVERAADHGDDHDDAGQDAP